MTICACGCGQTCRSRYLKGHNRRGVSPTNKIGVTRSNGYRYLYQPTHPQADKRGYVITAGRFDLPEEALVTPDVPDNAGH